MRNIFLLLVLILSLDAFSAYTPDIFTKSGTAISTKDATATVQSRGVKVTGSTSGTVTIQTPAAAGTPTVTLPTVNTTMPTALPTESAKALIATTAGVQSYAEGIANPNYIINGNFDFWQRGTSLADGVNTGTYLADRFKTLGNGSTIAKSQQPFTIGQTDVPNNPKYYARYVVTSSANAANYQISVHPIEGVRTLAGKVVTLSFYAKADATKPISIELGQVFGGAEAAVYAYPATRKFNLTTSWAKYVLNITLPSISGKTITEGSDYLSIIFWMDAGSNNNTRTDSLGQQSGTFDFAQIKLEEGSVATPFVRAGGTLAGELVACQRYFQKSYNIDVDPRTSTTVGAQVYQSASTGQVHQINIVPKVTMRAIPTPHIYSVTGAIDTVRYVTGATDIAMAYAYAGMGGVGAYPTANFTADQLYSYHWTLESEL